ncbi:hypothetical protein ACJX0J_014618, partial [Zea mays]
NLIKPFFFFAAAVVSKMNELSFTICILRRATVDVMAMFTLNLVQLHQIYNHALNELIKMILIFGNIFWKEGSFSSMKVPFEFIWKTKMPPKNQGLSLAYTKKIFLKKI